MHNSFYPFDVSTLHFIIIIIKKIVCAKYLTKFKS